MAVQLFAILCSDCGIVTDDRNVRELPIDKAEARANLHDLATGHSVVIVEVVDVLPHVRFPVQGEGHTHKPHGNVRDRFTPDHHSARCPSC